MKLLVIGTDASIFKPDSEARGRIAAYSRLFDELHIIIFTAPGCTPEAFERVHLYPTNSRWLLRRPFDAARIGWRIAREQAIDIISVQDPAESGLAGWLLKRATGAPLHIQLHTDILSPYFRRNSWKERVRYWLARFILRRGDAFRVVSARIRTSLNSKFRIPNSKIMVLPIFVDREAIARARPVFILRQKYPEFDFIVLMVSRLNRDKRIDVALDAFAEFRDEYPRSGLIIVGDGPEREKSEVKSEKLKVSEGVVFKEWQKDLTSYYKGADVYLLTSAFEGYGRTVIEAAAAGVPIIMTDVGVAGEIISDGETGRVVPVGDRAALARALIAARREYPTMQQMAERAQVKVRSLPPRTWAEYLECYRGAFAIGENSSQHDRR